MVTHDARAAATADRVLFLADGRVVADLAGPTEEAILGAMKDAAPGMIRVALKGLAARPVRTALTTLAIVIGVAFVCAAYTLTDTMSGAADIAHARRLRRHGCRRRHEDRVPRLADRRRPRAGADDLGRRAGARSAARRASRSPSATSPTPRR